MPRYRRCSVVACKNRRIPTEEKVFTFPYVKEIAEEWVRFSNNPDLRVEDAHLYAKRGRVMCHRHFASNQFTTPKRLRLNRGAVPTNLNSSDEMYDAPEQGVSPPHNLCGKESPPLDGIGLEGYDSCENEEDSHSLSRVKNETLVPEVKLTIPVKDEKEVADDQDNNVAIKLEVESDCPVQQHEDTGDLPVQNENVSPT